MNAIHFRKSIGILCLCLAVCFPSYRLQANPENGNPGKDLPRSALAAEKVNAQGVANYLEAIKKSNQEIHSLMIVRNGKVVSETWFGDNAPGKPHVMYSVSKTFTATAIGFAVAEGKLNVTDKVISFFPDKVPATISNNLKELEIRHLLTMSSGH
ncbi:MAG: beta-lactamase family protein, partial [Tannerella sp.]|nr:beta-lactamase family protein [Tannerella sp.]